MNRISENTRSFTLSADYVELFEISEEIANRFFVVTDSRRDDRTIAPVAATEKGVLFADMSLSRVVDVEDLVPTR